MNYLGGAMTANLLISVAQNIRRSTEHQQYSLENQSVAIEKYAESHDFRVVLTYFDAKTGLVFKQRAGLRQMLQDVVAETPLYKAILVYDVSRWGRFQDTDESAHYEFLCKSAGIPAHYCAETFVNDGTLPNMLMKALKRTMAVEYGRELGVKVVAGLKRLARLGFKQAGCPGYGLRPMLVSARGEPKLQLAQWRMQKYHYRPRHFGSRSYGRSRMRPRNLPALHRRETYLLQHRSGTQSKKDEIPRQR
jgi:DNA invertase Pin-like site-specific DNA recombinase